MAFSLLFLILMCWPPVSSLTSMFSDHSRFSWSCFKHQRNFHLFIYRKRLQDKQIWLNNNWVDANSYERKIYYCSSSIPNHSSSILRVHFDNRPRVSRKTPLNTWNIPNWSWKSIECVKVSFEIHCTIEKWCDFRVLES